jgi:hypothetical protein
MKVEQAYGCYGYVTTFNEQAAACQQCPLRKSCQVEAYKALKRLSAEIDVTSLMGRFRELVENDKDPIHMGKKPPKNRRQKLKQYSQGKNSALLIMHLPVKQRRIITGIQKKGIPVKNMLRGNSNPFDNYRPAFLRVPCRMLIEQGRFLRSQLKQALLQEFPHWSDRTAETQASIAVSVLSALNVIQKSNDVYYKVD